MRMPQMSSSQIQNVIQRPWRRRQDQQGCFERLRCDFAAGSARQYTLTVAHESYGVAALQRRDDVVGGQAPPQVTLDELLGELQSYIISRLPLPRHRR